MAVQVPGDEAARDARQLQSHWMGLVGAGLFAGALLGSTALIFSQLAALDSGKAITDPSRSRRAGRVARGLPPVGKLRLHGLRPRRGRRVALERRRGGSMTSTEAAHG